ncbi:LysR substrate-binding domain-containing protein [Hyphomicrobium sp.]|jgi:DNA-binding transcriptional LysR family regulator|uniref:LysR family transcriptional regulator n=1 Tax=Hyphomicrobium sp. TaxID=82 RepID=UPI00356A9A3F
MRGSEFAELRAFVTIAEQGNFARAAAHLRIAPSTLSQTIRELEKRLGVRLLNRTTRSVSLTEAGQRLLVRFKPALEEMQEAVRDVQNLSDVPAGTVRLHAPRKAASVLVEPHLGRFARSHPDIVLDITIDDAVVNIVEEGFDIGIRLGELLDEDMVAVKLGSDIRMCAVASPEYVAKHGMPANPGDLHNHRCINWRWAGRNGIYNWEFFKGGHWMSVAVDGPLIVSCSDMAISAAVQGVGVAFWAEYAVRPFIAKGQLVPMLEEFSPYFPGWYLTYPRQKHMSGAVRAVVEFLRCHGNPIEMQSEELAPV